MKITFVISLLLISISTLLAQPLTSQCGRLESTFDPDFAPFYHGVASGDALSDRVIIWTRVTPVNYTESIDVEWFMAEDSLFENIVTQGTFTTVEDIDWTVKVDVTGLEPDTWYFYYFRALDLNSIIGRTKTTPVGDTDSLRIATISGSNYNNGYYNVCHQIAVRNDVDYILHTGDYIYEYGTDEYGNHSERSLQPGHEVTTLSDYRMRYSHYRLDPDLRYSHQQFGWYIIYDDHETANNSWKDGAENHDSGSEGDWQTRKENALQAYFEWIPMREINDPEHPENKIHHTVTFGDLAASIMLDTRLEARDEQGGLANDNNQKRLLGDAQFDWLKMELYNYEYTTPIKWKLITQQVMMAPLKVAGIVVNNDQWDGYQFERQRVLDWIYGMSIKNTVVLTGDIHTSWANDVPNPTIGEYGSNGQGSGTVEFVTPSVTSPSTNSFFGGIGSGAIQLANPHMKWVNLDARGYYILDVNKTRCQADWYFINNINDRNYVESWAASWYVNDQESFLRQASIPSIRMTPNPGLAPEYPNQLVEVNQLYSDITNELVIIGAYPNPVEDKVFIQFFIKDSQEIKLNFTNNLGQIMFSKTFVSKCSDLNYYELDLSNYSSGNYFVTITTESGLSKTKQIIKK
ncbi:MAG: alkaline phosphatase D family protein [Bacteroidales bacterium]|nr:alkaline phosphatase D family protein [Bacteroidales bacterium]